MSPIIRRVNTVKAHSVRNFNSNSEKGEAYNRKCCKRSGEAEGGFSQPSIFKFSSYRITDPDDKQRRQFTMIHVEALQTINHDYLLKHFPVTKQSISDARKLS